MISLGYALSRFKVNLLRRVFAVEGSIGGFCYLIPKADAQKSVLRQIMQTLSSVNSHYASFDIVSGSMTEATMNSTNQSPLRQLGQLRSLLVICLLWLIPTLACGSFAPRPTPTPSPQPATPALILPGATEVGTPAPTPLPELAAETPTPESSPTVTDTVAAPAAPAGNVLAAGQPARVTAPAGLNYRQSPSSNAQLIGQFATGLLVTILEGPVQADNFTWWRLDDGSGNVGWAAEGDGDTVWITPQVGEPQAVDRSPRVGDRVIVSTAQLSVRTTPGTNSQLVVRVEPGQEFTVLAGPQSANGLNWYQIRNDSGDIEGWAAEGDGAIRWLSPLE